MEEQSVAVQYFLPFTVAMIMLAMGLGALAFALAAGLLDSVAVAIPAILYSILVYFTGAVVIADGRLRP